MEGNRNHDTDENTDDMSDDATNRKFSPAEPLPLGSSKRKCKSRAMHGVCGSFPFSSLDVSQYANLAAYDAPSNHGKKRKSVSSNAANAASWTNLAQN